jgi:hypothetical protein
MLEKGWIQPFSSSYGAPVLFVPKPDGSYNRMCVDCCALNKIANQNYLKNKCPLPRMLIRILFIALWSYSIERLGLRDLFTLGQ